MIDWLIAQRRERPAFLTTITAGHAIGRLRVGTLALALVVCTGALFVTTPSMAQTASSGGSGETSQLLPADRQEIADQERLSSWTVNKIPPQPYMNEVYWNMPADTPAFFRDSLVQFVARTYDLTRDNADGTRSQGWAVGGWLAFRSGLVDDIFGVHQAAGAGAELDRDTRPDLWTSAVRRPGIPRRLSAGRHAADQPAG
jgi:hypothetical protein